MKISTILIALAVCFSAVAMAAANAEFGESSLVSVLETASIQDDVPASVEPVLQLQPPVVGETVVQKPMSVMEPMVMEPMVMEPMVMGPMVMGQPIVTAPVENGCCQTCCRRRCRCCPPPPVPTVFCLQDPCGCSHEACVDVPACCAGEQPCITWRQGLLKRQIATLCWACCDHEVKIIISRSGKVRVRD